MTLVVSCVYTEMWTTYVLRPEIRLIVCAVLSLSIENYRVMSFAFLSFTKSLSDLASGYSCTWPM